MPNASSGLEGARKFTPPPAQYAMGKIRIETEIDTSDHSVTERVIQETEKVKSEKINRERNGTNSTQKTTITGTTESGSESTTIEIRG